MVKRTCFSCSACVPFSKTDGFCRASPAAPLIVGFEEPTVIAGKRRLGNPLIAGFWPTVPLNGPIGCRDGWRESTVLTDVPGREEGLKTNGLKRGQLYPYTVAEHDGGVVIVS